jgi:pilus assembly protein CpaC
MRALSEINPMINFLPRLHTTGSFMKISSCAAALLAATMAFMPLLTDPVKATDMSVASASEADQSRLVRIGVNKSIIIHLPADAKDVIVGDPSIVDVVVRSKNTAYLFARTNGQTNIFFLDANGQQVMALDLEVSIDTLSLRKLLQRSLPGTHITVDSSGNNIILGGTALNAAEAKTAQDLVFQIEGTSAGGGGKGNILNMIKIAGEDQVMLQVKVVEIQRNVLKQFGINFRALINAGKFAFSLASNNPFTSNLISADNGYKASYASGTNNFDSLITAMEGDGLLRTLAEPNLTALSGQSATFLAGGQFPYTICSFATTNVRDCSVSFKDFGVSLNFTPTVLTDGRINLKIHSDVSNLNAVITGDQNIPGIDKRSVDTVLELPNGGSMMMAGLIQESLRQNINGTPGLKQLPVLGALFRSRDYTSNETELVIIVTPHIVRSASQQQLQSPDQNLSPVTDRQAVFMGRMNKIYGTNGKAPVGDYKGDVGFIVE